MCQVNINYQANASVAGKRELSGKCELSGMNTKHEIQIIWFFRYSGSGFSGFSYDNVHRVLRLEHSFTRNRGAS